MNRLNNLPLGVRLTLGFGIVLLLMAAMVALALVRTASIDDIGERLVGSDFTKAEAVAALDAATRGNVRRTMELFHVNEPADVERLRQHIETNRKVVIDALSTLDRLVASSEGLDLLTKLKSARARFAASFSQVDSTLAAGNREEALRLLKSETLPAIDVLQAQVSALSALQKHIVDHSGREMRAAVRSTQWVLIGAGATALVAGMLIAWALTRSITAPIAQALKVAHTVAAGDLCSRIVSGQSTTPLQ